MDTAEMARLAAGHSAALNGLMERHAERVFHFLVRMLRHEEDANDLAQETFVRVFQHRTRFRPGSKFTTWLYTIAGNLARNHHRWRARRPEVSLDAPHAGSDLPLSDALPAPTAPPDDAAVEAEHHAMVRDAVAGLPDELREAVVLCEWEELSVVEAAAIAHTTPKALESRLYRARQQLRHRLARQL